MFNLSYHARIKLVKLESGQARRLGADLLLLCKLLFCHIRPSVVNLFKLETIERMESLRRKFLSADRHFTGLRAVNVFLLKESLD